MTIRGAEVEGTGLDVGFVCAGWPPDVGGIESHAQDLARELAARGHRVHVLCMDGAEGLDPYTTRTRDVDGVQVRRMAYRYHDHRAMADLVRNGRAEDVVMAWLAETPCDVVHVHHLTGFGLGTLRSLSDLGMPTVMTLHDYWPLCPRGQMIDVQLELVERPEPSRCAPCLARTWPHLMPSSGGEKRGPAGERAPDDETVARLRTDFALACLRLPQRLLTPSAASREVFVRAGLERESIEVCANGIEVGDLAEAVRAARAVRAPDEVGSVHLGVLGTVLPSKGVVELALAFREADVPGLVLDVHGNLPSYHGDTSYVERLRALAAEDERIVVHGPYARAELPGILAQLDGVAAPSRWEEVFGLTVREARAAGLPVLVSDAGDLPAVAAEGRAGLVVPRDDRAAWVDALRRFGTDADARARWAAAETLPRSAHDMMLQLERAYRDAIAAVGAAERLAPPPPKGAQRKPGFFARLFGRRG